MLILTRRPGEEIHLTLNGQRVRVIVDSIQGQRVRLALDAPRVVEIRRPEAKERKAA